jgi:hypothetical protein
MYQSCEILLSRRVNSGDAGRIRRSVSLAEGVLACYGE